MHNGGSIREIMHLANWCHPLGFQAGVYTLLIIHLEGFNKLVLE